MKIIKIGIAPQAKIRERVLAITKVIGSQDLVHVYALIVSSSE